MPEKNFVEQLQRGIQTCYRLTKPMRKKRKKIFDEYAAGYFGESAQQVKKPLNMVWRDMSVIVPLIVSQNPKVMVRARILPLKPFAETLRLTLNHVIGEINLRQTLRMVVINSMMYFGVTKTGIAEGGLQVEDAFGYLHDAGQLYCDNIDGDDYVWDVAGRVREEFDFEGNRYRVPLDYIIESGLYKNYDKLSPKYTGYGEDGGKRPERTAKETLRNFEINEIRPYVELYDLWIPSDNIVMTIPSEGQGNEPLRIIEWNGPEGGPYDFLSYHEFPESIVPIPPIYSRLDLHQYINTLARKMGRQADREKTILVYDGAADEDAKRAIQATDGESIRVDNIDRVKEIKFGGINEAAYPYMFWLKQMWSEQANNADLIGGIRPQAETLGQEQMLQANATIGIQDMIWQVHHFTASILRKMAWYIWSDPLIDITVSKRIGAGMNLDVVYNEEAREGDFLDYEFDIEPYSMQRMNPAMRRQAIMELINGIVIPTAQLAAMQGDILQVAPLVKAVARDLDLTEAEVDEWYKSSSEPINTQMGPYQPLQGFAVPKSGQPSDQRGATMASKSANMRQQQTRAGGKSSPPQE